MNPVELFHEDGKSAGVYYCSKCEKITGKGSHKQAEDCCEPYICKYCSLPVDSEVEGKYKMVHYACQEKADFDKQQETMNKAKKLEDWQGYLWYDEHIFVCMEDLTDYMDCQFSEEENWPEFVFVAKPHELHKVSIRDILKIFRKKAFLTNLLMKSLLKIYN